MNRRDQEKLLQLLALLKRAKPEDRPKLLALLQKRERGEEPREPILFKKNLNNPPQIQLHPNPELAQAASRQNPQRLDPKHLHSRQMVQEAHRLGLPFYQKQDQESVKDKEKNFRFIKINSVEYKILVGNVQVRDEPVVSIGSSPEGREWITFEPNEVMKQKYQELKKVLGAQKATTQEQINDVLNKIILFARGPQGFNYRPGSDLEGEIKAFAATQPTSTEFKVPVIPLERFFTAGGVCRHHSLFVSYLTNKLIQDGILPPGQAYHHRDRIDRGGHAWVIYQPNVSPPYFLIDSMWGKTFELPKYEAEVRQHYGDAAMNECIARYPAQAKKEAAVPTVAVPSAIPKAANLAVKTVPIDQRSKEIRLIRILTNQAPYSGEKSFNDSTPEERRRLFETALKEGKFDGPSNFPYPTLESARKDCSSLSVPGAKLVPVIVSQYKEDKESKSCYIHGYEHMNEKFEVGVQVLKQPVRILSQQSFSASGQSSSLAKHTLWDADFIQEEAKILAAIERQQETAQPLPSSTSTAPKLGGH